MAIEINGSGTITGLTAGGLPDATVTADDLASTLDLSGKTVTLPSGTGGKILQVVSATKTDTQTTTSATPVAVTGLSASITPTTDGNTVLAIVTTALSNASDAYTSYIHLYKGGSVVTGAQGAAAGSRAQAWAGVRGGSRGEPHSVSASYLDTTSGTTSITYQVYFSTENIGTAVINRTGFDSDGTSYGRFASTITLLEVAQ